MMLNKILRFFSPWVYHQQQCPTENMVAFGQRPLSPFRENSSIAPRSKPPSLSFEAARFLGSLDRQHHPGTDGFVGMGGRFHCSKLL